MKKVKYIALLFFTLMFGVIIFDLMALAFILIKNTTGYCSDWMQQIINLNIKIFHDITYFMSN